MPRNLVDWLEVASANLADASPSISRHEIGALNLVVPDRVDDISGGRRLKTNMAAHTFDAATAPAAVPALIDAIAALVREVNEPG